MRAERVLVPFLLRICRLREKRCESSFRISEHFRFNLLGWKLYYASLLLGDLPSSPPIPLLR